MQTVLHKAVIKQYRLLHKIIETFAFFFLSFLSVFFSFTAWQHSYARARTFHFSKAFSKKFVGVFVTKLGNPNQFNWQDITGKKIGFIDGFVFDEFCVAREADQITVRVYDEVCAYATCILI